MIVQSPGHAKVADLDGLVLRNEAVAARNVAMDEAHLVQEEEKEEEGGGRKKRRKKRRKKKRKEEEEGGGGR